MGGRKLKQKTRIFPGGVIDQVHFKNSLVRRKRRPRS
jgi:hypothetical protein